MKASTGAPRQWLNLITPPNLDSQSLGGTRPHWTLGKWDPEAVHLNVDVIPPGVVIGSTSTRPHARIPDRLSIGAQEAFCLPFASRVFPTDRWGATSTFIYPLRVFFDRKNYQPWAEFVSTTIFTMPCQKGGNVVRGILVPTQCRSSSDSPDIGTVLGPARRSRIFPRPRKEEEELARHHTATDTITISTLRKHIFRRLTYCTGVAFCEGLWAVGADSRFRPIPL
ncbi:hypothetical protein QBC41DRAFT_1973 [Cercophora samala]|uniref:Uncharacterized protein n=1 Tax=Cercophora samala TaxID=330535 RepID=A0AA40DF61_9PEZI|nr:hypothetical protein QBC41DRAFT_1973 [Cercophora samala]